MPYLEVPSYDTYEKLRDGDFSKLMDEAIRLRSEMDELNRQLSGIKEEMDMEMALAAVEGSVEYKGWQLRSVTKAGSRSLDKKKLLRALTNELGSSVAMELMKAATVVGKPSHYVQLVSPKEADKTTEGDTN